MPQGPGPSVLLQHLQQQPAHVHLLGPPAAVQLPPHPAYGAGTRTPAVLAPTPAPPRPAFQAGSHLGPLSPGILSPPQPSPTAPTPQALEPLPDAGALIAQAAAQHVLAALATPLAAPPARGGTPLGAVLHPWQLAPSPLGTPPVPHLVAARLVAWAPPEPSRVGASLVFEGAGGTVVLRDGKQHTCRLIAPSTWNDPGILYQEHERPMKPRLKAMAVPFNTTARRPPEGAERGMKRLCRDFQVPLVGLSELKQKTVGVNRPCTLVVPCESGDPNTHDYTAAYLTTVTTSASALEAGQFTRYMEGEVRMLLLHSGAGYGEKGDRRWRRIGLPEGHEAMMSSPGLSDFPPSCFVAVSAFDPEVVVLMALRLPQQGSVLVLWRHRRFNPRSDLTTYMEVGHFDNLRHMHGALRDAVLAGRVASYNP